MQGVLGRRADMACHQCSDEREPFMIQNGIACRDFTWGHENRCNSFDEWKWHKLCQQTCFEVGNGYEGDNCCLSPQKPPVDLIIDTDLSVDVGDVGALCVAHALADRGEARLLGVLHDTGLAAGAGAISVINEHYGRGYVRVGAYRGPVGNPAEVDKPTWVNKGRGVSACRVSNARVGNSSVSREERFLMPTCGVVVCIG